MLEVIENDEIYIVDIQFSTLTGIATTASTNTINLTKTVSPIINTIDDVINLIRLYAIYGEQFSNVLRPLNEYLFCRQRRHCLLHLWICYPLLYTLWHLFQNAFKDWTSNNDFRQ